MVGLNTLFDQYATRARLLPALLVALPVAAVVALLFPNLYATYGTVFGSLGIVAVGLFVLAHVIRANGRALEGRLFQKWGGVPSTAWLRHRDPRLDPNTKARYHKFLAAHVPELRIPSAAEEAADYRAADHAYASAVKWLLEYTRDAKLYELVFEENVSYGFRRNTLAAKPLALVTIFILAIVAAWVTYSRFDGHVEHFSPEIIAAWLVIAGDLSLWIRLVTEAWVKDASDGYSRALLAACDKA